jgi:hypothetical protein
MQRRSFVRLTVLTVLSGLLQAVCGKNQIAPTSPPVSPINPPIDPSRVGPLRFSKVSSSDGYLLEICDALKLAVVSQAYQGKDSCTGIPFSGFFIISLLGEQSADGWVIGVDDRHCQFDSVQGFFVKAGSKIDFYYGKRSAICS